MGQTWELLVPVYFLLQSALRLLVNPPPPCFVKSLPLKNLKERPETILFLIELGAKDKVIPTIKIIKYLDQAPNCE